MKIENRTHWDTAHLTAFIKRVAAEELDPARRKALKVNFQYNRQTDNGSCSGRASCPGHHAIIMLPRKTVDRIDLAHVIAHELAHTRGMEHRQMTNNPTYNRVGNWREIYAWAEGLSLDRKQPKVKPRVGVQALRYNRVLASEKAWTTKLKRAQTALAKLRKKRRYYEKALAARQNPKPGGAHDDNV